MKQTNNGCCYCQVIVFDGLGTTSAPSLILHILWQSLNQQNRLHAASVLMVHRRISKIWQMLEIKLMAAQASKDQLKRNAKVWPRTSDTDQRIEVEWTLDWHLKGGVHWKQKMDSDLMQKWPCVFWMSELTSSSFMLAEQLFSLFQIYIICIHLAAFVCPASAYFAANFMTSWTSQANGFGVECKTEEMTSVNLFVLCFVLLLMLEGEKSVCPNCFRGLCLSRHSLG